MPTPSAAHSIRCFHDVGRINVWSLLVTVFGDLAQQDGTSLSGPQLSAIFQAVGIKPEALRVALHRLTKDGWIISERTGRTSNYRLSSIGLDNTNRAWTRVYEPNQGTSMQWHTIVAPNGLIDSNTSSIKLAPQTYIAEERVVANNPTAMVMPFDVQTAPAWVEERILSDGLEELSTSLLSALHSFPGFESMPNGLDKVSVRLLCLHHWRRIALRDAAWLHIKHYESGHLRLCHDMTHKLLIALPRDNALRLIKEL